MAEQALTSRGLLCKRQSKPLLAVVCFVNTVLQRVGVGTPLLAHSSNRLSLHFLHVVI